MRSPLIARPFGRIAVFLLLSCGILAPIAANPNPQARGQARAQAPRADEGERTYWVDAQRGTRAGRGTQDQPYPSLSNALSKLPDPLTHSVTIHIAQGNYDTTGGQDMSANRLDLMQRMRPGVEVRIVGQPDSDGQLPRFAWEGDTAMVDVSEGRWSLENIQIGNGTLRQRRGVMVTGPAQITLKNITFRTRSLSDAAIYSHRGGLALLRGAIRINEHLHDAAGEETFAGIIATEYGMVRFDETTGASLEMGNGSLSASYYGCIGLGCTTARITNWTDQSNPLAINNSGRIDLHNTTTTLRARQKRNTPIGLEHDGHILAEDAHIIIEGENEMAIALQKASTLTCNDIELRGKFGQSLWASSGSMFVGRFLSDVSDIAANTSARINIEEMKGQIRGQVTATHGGIVALPDRTVVSQ